MINGPLVLGHRRCWYCGRNTPILWDAALDRAYCPLCEYTQPPRRAPVTREERRAWTRLRHRYFFREGVGLDEQRGRKPDGDLGDRGG